MREGTLIYDALSGRCDIRFNLEEYYGGLHCGETLEALTDTRWLPTRIEMGEDWYLVGIHTNNILGLRVRI